MLLRFILSIPKSFYVSCRLFSFSTAFILPCLVSYNTKINSLKGRIVFSGKPRRGVFSFGFGNVGVFDQERERSILEIDGTIEIGGQTNFGHGCRVSIGKNGVLKIGENFVTTAASTFICFNRMTIGANCLISWNVFVMDTDFHDVGIPNIGNVKNEVGYSIMIGSDVWIGMKCVILKNTTIPDGCVIGASSVVTKRFQTSNCLIAGNPAKEVRQGIVWMK